MGYSLRAEAYRSSGYSHTVATHWTRGDIRAEALRAPHRTGIHPSQHEAPMAGKNHAFRSMTKAMSEAASPDTITMANAYTLTIYQLRQELTRRGIFDDVFGPEGEKRRISYESCLEVGPSMPPMCAVVGPLPSCIPLSILC